MPSLRMCAFTSFPGALAAHVCVQTVNEALAACVCVQTVNDTLTAHV